MENKNKITYPLSLKDRVDYINEIEKLVLEVVVDEISNLFPKTVIKILYAPWCHFAVHALYGGYEKIKINNDHNWRPELAPGDTQNFMVFAMRSCKCSNVVSLSSKLGTSIPASLAAPALIVSLVICI